MSEIVVALDFDGVVWDSVDEAFDMAYRAWCDMHGAPPTPKARLGEMFRAARWQAKDGHDFYIIMAALAENPPRDLAHMPVEEFDALREARAKGPDAERFVNGFYEHRKRMRTDDFDGWMELQRPFPGVASQIQKIRQQARGVAVATTKDAHSAERLLETVGIQGVRVYGREVSLDKADHMRAISSQFEIPTSRIVFVEDLLENLLPLLPLGVRPVLADWGYNTPAERARAESLGVTVASVATLAQTVLGVGALSPPGP